MDDRENSSMPRAERRVLVVDDDPDFADTIAHLLRLDGYVVEVAYKFSAAKTALDHFPAEVVLTDIRMDERSGLSLVSELRSSHPNISCVMMTAYASVDTAIKALQAGAYDYLCKPFFQQDLMATLDRCFERITLTRDREEAEAALRERNRELEALNVRLERVLSGMQLLSTCSTLRDLCGVLLEQVVGQTKASRGSIHLKSGDLEIIEHAVGGQDVGQVPERPGAAKLTGDAPGHLPLEFPLFGAAGEMVGEVVVEGSRSGSPTQQDREFAQILLSYAGEAIRTLQAAERLSWSEARLRDIVDHSPSLISLADLEGRFLIVNTRFEKRHGLQAEAAVGKVPQELFPPDVAGLYAASFQEVLQGRRMLDREIEVLLADGLSHAMMVTQFPVLADDGRPVWIVTIATDVTERRRAEEQLRQSQKMEALGQLTGGIAHDFNNLLAVISGNLSLIDEGRDRQGDIAELVEDALSASKTGAELTHRLLAFGRRQDLRPKPTDAGRLIMGMTRLLERTLGEAIQIEKALAEDLWPIEIDRSQLETSILNLALNARDAMPDGGVLTLEAANVTGDPAAPLGRAESLADPEQFVAVAVSDTGTGMTAEVIERAIQPFFTTKSEGQGSGLGLSMVYGFAAQSGGRLDISSAPAGGTKVILLLPRARDEAPQASSGQRPALQPLQSNEKILVVEDQPKLRKLVRKTLTRLGYRVLEAEDGPMALNILAGTPDVNLLLADIVLPQGMSGVELARQAQSRYPGLRVLFTSGFAPDDALRGIADGAPLPLLKKPYQKDALAQMVRQALDSEMVKLVDQ